MYIFDKEQQTLISSICFLSIKIFINGRNPPPTKSRQSRGVRCASLRETPVQPDFKTSSVIVTSEMLSRPNAFSIGRDAALAQRYAICHGPERERRLFA
jgi:hypothetical protein